MGTEECRKLLHHLGFRLRRTGHKSTYIDGHKRDDVRLYRNKYIEYVTSLESSHLPPPAPSDVVSVSSSIHSVGNIVAVKKLVTIFHDECSFQSNDDQSYMWALEDQSCIRPKNRGIGLMVSDFID